VSKLSILGNKTLKGYSGEGTGTDTKQLTGDCEMQESTLSGIRENPHKPKFFSR